MGGDVEAIKERLDIVEVVTPYLKVEKTGANYKARCPFHNEKTASLYLSTARQSYYCFGCGAKGDIFTFIQEVEGVDFREALKMLAEKAGVELKRQDVGDAQRRTEKDQLLSILEEATKFFQEELKKNSSAQEYLLSRGMTSDSIEHWRIGFSLDEWRGLYSHLTSLGYKTDLIIKAGLAKHAPGKEKNEPYDVFRGRIVFPLADSSGRIVAFSGRALAPDTEPKYLNSPDTILFTKSELLYGLDKAKEDIRKKNYAVLVEGQMDLVLSHQIGVKNTVASSGTAFTSQHLERLKKLSPRIVLAFDGDTAGDKAGEKSAVLGLSLGMEVKIAASPKGSDPADVIKADPDAWRDILRKSLPAIEHFLGKIIEEEKDHRKLGKLVESKILPLITLVQSAIERAHFVSLISKRTGIKEEMLWEDLRRVRMPAQVSSPATVVSDARAEGGRSAVRPRREIILERVAELASWRKEMEGDKATLEMIEMEEAELSSYLSHEELQENLMRLTAELSRAEAVKDEETVKVLSEEIAGLHNKMRALEEKRKVM